MLKHIPELEKQLWLLRMYQQMFIYFFLSALIYLEISFMHF